MTARFVSRLSLIRGAEIPVLRPGVPSLLGVPTSAAMSVAVFGSLSATFTRPPPLASISRPRRRSHAHASLAVPAKRPAQSTRARKSSASVVDRQIRPSVASWLTRGRSTEQVVDEVRVERRELDQRDDGPHGISFQPVRVSCLTRETGRRGADVPDRGLLSVQGTRSHSRERWSQHDIAETSHDVRTGRTR